MAVVLYGILGVVGGLECWSGDMALLTFDQSNYRPSRQFSEALLKGRVGGARNFQGDLSYHSVEEFGGLAT